MENENNIQNETAEELTELKAPKKGWFSRLKETRLGKKVTQTFENIRDEHKVEKMFNSDNSIILNIILDDKTIKNVVFKYNDKLNELYCLKQFNLSNLKYIENPKSGAKYYEVRILNDKKLFEYIVGQKILSVECFVYSYKKDKPIEFKQTINNINEVKNITAGKGAIVGDGNSKEINTNVKVGMNFPKS